MTIHIAIPRVRMASGYLGRDDLLEHGPRSTRHGPTGRREGQPPAAGTGPGTLPDPPHTEHVTRLPPITWYLGEVTYRIVQCTLPIPWHLGHIRWLGQNISARRLSWVCSVIASSPGHHHRRLGLRATTTGPSGNARCGDAGAAIDLTGFGARAAGLAPDSAKRYARASSRSIAAWYAPSSARSPVRSRRSLRVAIISWIAAIGSAWSAERARELPGDRKSTR